MKSLALILCLCLAGCDGLIVQPKGQPEATPDAAIRPQVSQKEFFTAFASEVDSGLFPDTQSVLKGALKSMHKLGVATPPTYDAVMKPYMDNAPLTDALRAKLVSDLRGFAK